MRGLEVTGAGKHGLAVWSRQNLFSAHNVIIEIDDCIVSSCNLAGLKIEDLALSALRINNSEFSANDYGGVQLRQVHQKSNLPQKLQMIDTLVTETQYASGLVLKDCGLFVKSCRFDRNNDDGIRIDCSTYALPKHELQEEVCNFLRRSPMDIVINDCEIYYNQRNGIFVQDYWKGPIEISDCIIVGNLEYGVFSTRVNGTPHLDETDEKALRQLDPRRSMNRIQLNRLGGK